MKDHFSEQAVAYAQFRPHYPPDLFDYLLSEVKEKNAAWDCGTGNGQVAGVLADHFTRVLATDISAPQLDNAIRKPNIEYRIQQAEQPYVSTIPFDLITVAQAIHWFGFDAFYQVVKQNLQPGAVFAIIGYGLLQTERPLQAVIDLFYTNTIHPYWDPERRYVDTRYQTLPFPFTEIKTPSFRMEYTWSLNQLLGYIGTWSAVKQYRRQLNKDPLVLLSAQLKKNWGSAENHSFSFPLFLRMGR